MRHGSYPTSGRPTRLASLAVLAAVALPAPAVAQDAARLAEPAARAGLVRPSLALVPFGRPIGLKPAAVPNARLAAPPGMPPAVCPPAPPPAAAVPKPSADALPHRPFPATWQRTIDALAANGSIPGAVIIVKSPDWGVRLGVTGEADLVSHQKMSPDLHFRVGSVSKAFLAQAILRLEQEGRIKLTDTPLTYLGDDRIVAGIPYIGQITIANLLQMTSGVSNYLDATSIGDSPQVTPHRAFKPDELMGVLSAAGPPVPGVPAGQPLVQPYFVPGFSYPNPFWETVLDKQPPSPVPAPYPAWNYSNSNYILLGMIAEKVTGLPADQILKKYVFDVAGLKDTSFATSDMPLPEMHGYTRYGAIPYPNPVYTTWCDVTAIDPSYAWTAGAIVSTPWDLLKFEDTIFTTDILLNQGTKTKWLTLVSSDIHPGWEEMQYGVGGLMQPERSYGTARGHGGAFPGFKTLMYYFFDQKTSFVLASNTWDEEWEVAMLDAIMPQVSSAATTPRPDNGATVAPANGTMHVAWQPGRVYGSSYDVWWGDSVEAVDRASAASHDGVRHTSTTATAADLAVAAAATTYWRVDTVAPGQALPLVIGPTWRFETR